MTDVADASGAAPLDVKPSTSKKAVKPRKPVQPAEHPKYREMIATAIRNLKERKGSSRQAILKHIMASYKVGSEVNKINSRVKMALRAGIKSGTFKQIKGTGASGSFRLGEKTTTKSVKPKMAKKPKPAAKKPTFKKAKTSGKKKAAATTRKVVSKKPKSAAIKKLKGKSPKKAAAKKPKTKSPAKKVAKPKKMAKKIPAKKTSKPKTHKK